MKQQIRAHSAVIVGPDGTPYRVSSWGEPRADGTWWGWIEFEPRTGDGPKLSTGQETSQPNRAALAYWASGLEVVYLEGAFVRAWEGRGSGLPAV